jgi:transposase
MANRIKMSEIAAILGLWRQRWPLRRIARELGLDRKTVRRYVQRQGNDSLGGVGDSKGTKVPPGKPGSKGAKVPPGDLRGRSRCEPYREPIETWLEQGLSGQRIYQDLVCEYGFEGSYDSVKRFVRSLKKAHPKRIYRIEALPGEEAQVDFGTGAPILRGDGRRRRRTHIFRVVLSYSRKAYCEAVLRQDTETFLRCLENAFRYFGGVPQTLNVDNLRAAVAKAHWYEPEVNPKLASFCTHYDTVILPCRPGKPEHKGKVESSVKYVKNNALKGRVFGCLNEENRFLREWEQKVADGRIHGTTRAQVRQRFEEVEKPALSALPLSLFPCFREGPRRVHRDSYVEVAGAYYEVPEEYIGRQVWVRWDSRTVRVFNKRFEQVRILSRRAAGQYSRHLSAHGRRHVSVERDTAFWIGRCTRLGEDCGLWAVEVMAKQGAPGIRVLQGLLALTKKHSTAVLNNACRQAVSLGAYRLRELKRLIQRPAHQEAFAFMERHPVIRDMQEYTAFLDMVYPQDEPLQQEVP